MKEKLLGVSHETLERYTADQRRNSRLKWTDGSRRLYGSDIAVSTTGIAGPGGGTEEQPVALFTPASAALGEPSFTATSTTAAVLKSNAVLPYGPSIM